MIKRSERRRTNTRSILRQILAPCLALVLVSFAIVAALTAVSRANSAAQMFGQKVALSTELSRDPVTTAVWILDASALRSAVAPIVRDEDVKLVHIMDTRGEVLLSHGDASLLGDASALTRRPADGAAPTMARSEGLLRVTVPLERVEEGVSQHIGGMLIVYDRATVVRTAWFTVLWVVGVGLLAAALIVALLVVLVRRITQPLSKLATAMSTLSSGDLDTQVNDVDRLDEVGEMARSVQVFKDNALRLRAAELERARADAANQAKSQFLAHMSHELRTPLNGVLTMADLMARNRLDAKQRERLDVILMSGRDLLQVINDVLDFSKIEAGRLDIEHIAFDADAVLEEVRASFALVAERKGLSLVVERPESGLGLRLGDPNRLRQIVGNYVANAIKFTVTGGVVVKADCIGASGEETLVIAVRDTGIGIAAENLDKLFQRFSQVDASTTRKFGGTGLGLAICHELASQMGGDAWAESTPGVGSIFHLKLPAPPAPLPSAEAPASSTDGAGLDTLKILAAEDNPTNQQVLRAIMTALGLEVTITRTGVEAVEAWRREAFDLILMDIFMPDMDGMEATREIRVLERTLPRKRTPIVALTANAFRHQVEEYAAVGMDGHIAKPIDLTQFVAVIERVVANAGEESAFVVE